MRENLVRDWMTPDPVSVSSVCTLCEAYHLMIDHKTRSLLVVDQGVLVGMVTMEDLRRRLPAALGLYGAVPGDQYADKTSVCRVMSEILKTIQVTPL